MKTYIAISILLLFTLISCVGKNAQKDNGADATVIISEATKSVRTDEYLYIGERRYNHKLSELNKITRFTIRLHPHDNRYSNSLEGIESLQNVNRLDIIGVNDKNNPDNSWLDISGIDFSPLNLLKNLKKIELSHATFNEIPDFSGIPSLEWIDINDCKIMSLNGIKTASQIKTLTISFEDNYFGSFEPLSGLVNMETLWINGSNLVTEDQERTVIRTAEFSGLEKLKRLFIDHIKTIDLAGIQNLNNLEYLDIGGGGRLPNVINIEAVAGLYNLREFHLSIYPESISSLSFLSSMTSLSQLYIKNNDRIAIAIYTIDVTPLQSLSNLEDLLLSGFIIRNFHLLDNLPKLTSVSVAGSRFDPVDNNKLQNAYVEYQIER